MLRIKLINSKICQWQDVCSMFLNWNMSELDLNINKQKKLSCELRHPRYKLQNVLCKSITPVRILKKLVLVLHGNNQLTHLNLGCFVHDNF